MLVQITGAKTIGIDAVKVTVEVDVAFGVGIHLCGLGDAAVKESLLRTATALESVGYKVPGKKIVINLAPADLRKSGTGYDLPIAIGILAASGQMECPHERDYLIMGELGLDGSVRMIPGALPFAELAIREGFKGIILPRSSALEAVELDGCEIYGVDTLSDVIRILESKEGCNDLLVFNSPEIREAGLSHLAQEYPDFADIIGQEGAKRGIEIACAGGHNVCLIGPPGSGKSSMAKAMAGILPPMSREESLVTSKIYSIAGKGDLRRGLIKTRPFRSPHYSASLAAIIGGGGGDGILPGEVSMAENGILFLDEFGQMPRSVVEALRGPMEDRYVTISRLRSKVSYPASFMLAAASNPCPCGYWGDGERCTCTPTQRQNYMSRLSGPILDRIDIQLMVKRIESAEIVSPRRRMATVEHSADIAARVLAARRIQLERFKGEEVFTNAGMSNRMIEKYCPLSEGCSGLLARLMDKCKLSMRAYFRIIKVARTIADLEGAADIREQHIAEAASYRFLDRGMV